MPLGEGRRGFTLAISLTEVALLLFFILLVLVTDLKVRSENTGEENRRLVAEAQLQAERLQTLNEAKDLLQEEYQGASSGQDGDFDSGAALDSDQEFLHLVRRLQQNAMRGVESVKQLGLLKLEKEEIEVQLEESTTTASSAFEHATELERQLAFVTSRTGPVGFGPPPCWLDPKSGEVEYIFNVTILEQGLAIKPTWPASRHEAAMLIPGIRDWPAGDISLDEFSLRAAPVLKWCKSQNPKCRLYVRIYDRAVSKESFKRHLLGVEDYFYKWLSPEYQERSDP
jgi:hypothetical protein